MPNRLMIAVTASLMALTPGAGLAQAQDRARTPTLTIHADQVQARVSPDLYGLMTEEINFSYEGGLYGELIRNRSFKADPSAPAWWDAVGDAKLSLDTATPLNAALDLSLKLDAGGASKARPAGIANGGYWGVPVRPRTTYRASFYAKGFKGPLKISLQSADGQKVFASADIKAAGGDWRRYEATLTTGDVAVTKAARFVLTTTQPGTVWLQQVSLFPPTYNNRANGDRPDLMRKLADMRPAFLRMPGGNYLEGDTIPERFDWKKTLGDPAARPGHQSPWKYWSTDGMGLLEFLEWCEDLHMQPVLAVYAGYSLHQDRVAAGPDLDGDLVGGTTDAAALDLELGLHVVDRTLERGDRLGAGLALHDVEGFVDDALGGGALAPLQDLVDQLGDDERPVDRVGHQLTAGGGTLAGHVSSPSWRRSGYGPACGRGRPRCRACRG